MTPRAERTEAALSIPAPAAVSVSEIGERATIRQASRRKRISISRVSRVNRD
jgi:hypothetical protein